jgi:hypothetical protein
LCYCLQQFGGPSLSRGVERQVGKVGRSRSLAVTVLHYLGRSNIRFRAYAFAPVFGSNMVSVVLLLLATGATVLAQKPLGNWQNGIATNYGGAQDGMDPYSPSFGTKEVGIFSPQLS